MDILNKVMGPQDIRTEIVTLFDSPNRVRYVLNEEDSLGQILKLRKNRGVVVASFTPVLAYGDTERQLPSLNSTFEVRPILQVVHANFLPGFDDALERFGLLAASSLIKNIIIERASYIFQGIGLEVRKSSPHDFALYSQVDLTGFDPNGIGLMGYDNTPGKDVGNERLHDRIGGVHALTQEDGYPGYGGVFLESFFGFSQAPPVGLNHIRERQHFSTTSSTCSPGIWSTRKCCGSCSIRSTACQSGLLDKCDQQVLKSIAPLPFSVT